MKKVLLFLFTVTVTVGVYAQISDGGMPLSFNQGLKSVGVIPTFQLQSVNIERLLQEDKVNGVDFRYGIVEDTILDLKSGLVTTVENGTIWRYEIYSENAKSMKLLFSDFDIPNGAKFFLYNSDYSVTYGAYTNENMNEGGTFAISDFPGEKLIVEYYEPSDVEYSGVLMINGISKAYREMDGMLSSDETASDYDDVNCGVGIDWQLEKHAVCKFTFVDDGSSYICSGALINNVNNDGTPYFLTANHCISSSSAALSVTAYFNYETKGCGLGYKDAETLSGTTLLTTGKKSDYTLLKFSKTPPAAYQPYYAGWDLSDTASSAVSIHHPEGYRKKISYTKDALQTYAYTINWDGGGTTPVNSHWLVYFEEGGTAGGSSGAPLFNQDRRIIGQLHGGGENDDYYGKLNYSWENTGSGYDDIGTYLVEDSSVTYVDGYTPEGNMPEAIFTTEFEFACVGGAVQFTDLSLFDVTEWKWEFSPSTYTFLDSTNENSQNPVICFNESGYYDVKLVVANAEGEDSVSFTSLISVGSTISIGYEANVKSETCFVDIDSITIDMSGASDYSWELTDGTPFFELETVDNAEVTIRQNSNYSIDSSIVVAGIIIGNHGVCVDTTSFSFELDLAYNDDIANATLLELGENGPYSNECASIQDGEPVPPAGECVSQSEWCDEYGTGEDLVENSVWFNFYAPESGYVAIETDGMDGQIALYEASSYSDILNGNYNLLAANDDKSSFNYASCIDKTAVIPNQMYWIQFDGSAGGSEGSFNITLRQKYASVVNDVTDEGNVILYPQPATDYITLKSSDFSDSQSIYVTIYGINGNIVFGGNIQAEAGLLTLNLDSSLPNGLYVISASYDEKCINKRFLKVSDVTE